MSNELAVVHSLPPAVVSSSAGTHLVDMANMVAIIARSGLAPNGLKNPEQMMVAAWHGQRIGLDTLAAIQSVAVINGRPTLWGDGLLATCQRSRVFDHERFKEWFEGEGDSMIAYCECARVGCPVVRDEFSVADARRAGLWGKSGPWSAYPKRMLKLRARSFALRDTFADVLMGFCAAEEMIDVEAEEVRPKSAPVSASAISEPEKPEANVARAELAARAEANAKNAAVEAVGKAASFLGVAESRILARLGITSAAEMTPELREQLRGLAGDVKSQGVDAVFPPLVAPNPAPEPADPGDDFPAEAGFTPPMEAMVTRYLRQLGPEVSEKMIRQIVSRNSVAGMPDADSIESEIESLGGGE